MLKIFSGISKLHRDNKSMWFFCYSIRYTKSVTDFKDFTGKKTALRTSINGLYTSISNKGIKVEYEYDVNGNITKITEDGRENLYYYNELNELIQEDIDNSSKSILASSFMLPSPKGQTLV